MTISPLALSAQHVIEAAWAAGPMQHLASQAAFALEAASMLQSPETAAEDAARHQRAGVALAVAQLRSRERETDLLALVDKVSADELVLYRAEYDSIPLGTYLTREAARQHCTAAMQRGEPNTAALYWIPDHDGDDALEDLAVIGAEGESTCTGYTVTPFEVTAVYDPDGDE